MMAPPYSGTGVPAGYRLALALGVALAGGMVAGSGSIGFKRAKTTVNPLNPEKASALVLVGVAAWLRWAPALLAAAGFVA